MPIYNVQDKETIAHLFNGWDETLIWSCLQGYMGVAYADSLMLPLSAQICTGDFIFFAGTVNHDLILNKPANLKTSYAILAPQNQEWEQAIEHCYKNKVTRHIRYATKKEQGVFDEEKLQSIITRLPVQYELKPIDRALFREILALQWARDLCSNYKSFEEYRSIGMGVVVQKDGNIVSGASSYTSFNGGIEIEIDTRKDERRKGLASACGASLILGCLKRGWYPSWDAHNKESLALAQKLGYHFDREYPVYEIEF
jgi:GNAT superfamily N-acetyltransferase